MKQQTRNGTEDRSAPLYLGRCPLCDSRRITSRFAARQVSKCSICGMLFRNPQPGEAQLKQFYDDAFRPEHVASSTTGMAGTTAALAGQYLAQVEQLFGLRGKSVLDFGAGLGTTSRVLMQAGAVVTAIEPFAYPECRRAGVATFRSVEELAEQARFDIIVAIQVIEHLRSPWESLAEFHRLLKPGGWLYVGTPNARGLSARIRCACWAQIAKPGHLIFYDPATWEKALRKAGFARLRRMRRAVQYASGARRLLQQLIQSMGLGGELRYLAQRTA